MQVMQTLHNDLLDLWSEKKEEYEEHLDSQKFKHDAENADSWIVAQEGFFKAVEEEVSWFVSHFFSKLQLLSSLKDSLDAVEEMLKKQSELEKMLKRQDEKFKLLERETKIERLERERIEAEERKIREEREARIREEQKRLEEIKREEEVCLLL